METSHNYQQQQAKGQEKQTVIIDSSLTAETDELDPKFDKNNDPRTDPDNSEETDNVDGEGIDDDFVGDDQEVNDEEPLPKEDPGLNNNDDIGLNHNEEDDLSLNS